ncbi:hypothetical protein ElyMa_006383300 [Elysia marginata]|uniref:Uncharacterized protein n=1 Tax=Elysia marginata TaxID=1093978 RepID=A0AAV4HNT7_9GAST|nr:hypothetical protein ElyMa_006383300 [Elysia marginata]
MEQAVRARAAAKVWLTKASAEIESLLSEAEADPVSVTESALVDCMEQFSKRLSAYDEAQGAVELVIDMKDLDSDISESADYRISKRKAYIRAGELLAKLTSNVEASGGGGSNKSRSSGVDSLKVFVSNGRESGRERKASWRDCYSSCSCRYNAENGLAPSRPRSGTVKSGNRGLRLQLYTQLQTRGTTDLVVVCALGNTALNAVLV